MNKTILSCISKLTCTAGIMGVDMDGNMRILLSDGIHKDGSCAGFQQTSHVLKV